MVIYGRDARIGPRSIKQLFSSTYRNPEANRLSGVYELSMRRASEAGSPGRILYWYYGCARHQQKIFSLFVNPSLIRSLSPTDTFYHIILVLCFYRRRGAT